MPPKLTSVLAAIDGSKTYAFSALLALLAVLDLSGLVPAESRTAVYSAVAAAIAASLRHAMTKLPPETLEKLARARELLQHIGDSLPPLPPPELPPPVILRAHIPALLIVVLIPWPAIADDANIRIVGPDGVPAAGFPCDLYIQGDVPEGTKITWDYFPKKEGVPLVEPRDGGRVGRLNTMSGIYKIIASITPPGAAPSVIRYKDFSVPGTPYVPPVPPAPTPVPPPVPPTPNPPTPPGPSPPAPAPEPAFPAGKFGLAEATYRIVQSVQSTDRKAEAACLLTKLQALVSDLQKGQVLSAQAVVDRIASAFDECLPASWDSARDKFTDRVAELHKAGRLPALSDWRTLIDESLLGLAAAAQR